MCSTLNKCLYCRRNVIGMSRRSCEHVCDFFAFSLRCQLKNATSFHILCFFLLFVLCTRNRCFHVYLYKIIIYIFWELYTVRISNEKNIMHIIFKIFQLFYVNESQFLHWFDTSTYVVIIVIAFSNLAFNHT